MPYSAILGNNQSPPPPLLTFPDSIHSRTRCRRRIISQPRRFRRVALRASMRSPSIRSEQGPPRPPPALPPCRAMPFPGSSRTFLPSTFLDVDSFQFNQLRSPASPSDHHLDATHFGIRPAPRRAGEDPPLPFCATPIPLPPCIHSPPIPSAVGPCLRCSTDSIPQMLRVNFDWAGGAETEFH